MEKVQIDLDHLKTFRKAKLGTEKLFLVQSNIIWPGWSKTILTCLKLSGKVQNYSRQKGFIHFSRIQVDRYWVFAGSGIKKTGDYG